MTQRGLSMWMKGALVLLGCVVLGSSGGCVSIAGRWTGSDLNPEMARDQFKFLQPADMPGKFVSTDLRLQQDGTYTAETNYDGRIDHSMGNWKWDSQKGLLTFSDKLGNSYGYGLNRIDDRNMQVVKGIKGTDVRLTLRKEP